MKKVWRHTLVWGLIGIWLLMVTALPLAAQQPQTPEVPPIWLDFDMENIPEPKVVETGYLYDFANNTFFQNVKQAFDFPRTLRAIRRRPKPAYNVNSVGEVPDSSWFTNRNGQQGRMSLAALKQGPNTGSGPVAGELTVMKAKSIGITPGFWIRDSAGVTYILKFDPINHPELATAAEVISTKLLYAIGYNVPENYLFRLDRSRLKISEKATYTDELGKKQAMTEADLDHILAKVHRQEDGVYRCVASKLLTGKPKGGFFFHGTRPDDPNDLIPHEHRRDLRGLRVFAAWLEHNDIRAGNTLDMYVSEGGRNFIRHYLIDFGSTLGSDSVFPNVPIVGYEYQVDGKEAVKSLVTLGIYERPWLNPEREPDFSPQVGRYGARFFNPRKWKPNFPLVAFENMTLADAIWAAHIVESFSDEQIRAVVEMGEYRRSADADYVFETLCRRRDLIVNSYLRSLWKPKRQVTR
ncbi:MAG: hypothetical protein HY774_23730 [Acidobacteria bacterium]|nr:hypothetical protein [Acidobacteriota bacterium]